MQYRIAINNLNGGYYEIIGHETDVNDILATVKELLSEVKTGQVVEITVEEE